MIAMKYMLPYYTYRIRKFWWIIDIFAATTWFILTVSIVCFSVYF
jgi:hypothetical protein